MNERDFNASVIIPNLAVLLFVAVGLFSDKTPLTSNRPPPPGDSSQESAKATARLWEDPFAIRRPVLSTPAPSREEKTETRTETKDDLGYAVSTYTKTISTTTKSEPKTEAKADDGVLTQSYLKAIVESPRAANAQPPSGHDGSTSKRPPRLLLLPVLLEGDNYAETRETRLRTRYAVLSALGRAQYVPLHHDQMQFVKIADRSVPYEDFEVRYLVADQVDLRGHENNTDLSKLPASAPQSEDSKVLTVDGPYDRIVVAWLNQTETLGKGGTGIKAAEALDESITKLAAALFGNPETTAATKSGPGGKPPAPLLGYDVKVIGPADTDSLVDLLEELPPGQPSKPILTSRPGAPTFKLLSARATAAPKVIDISLKRPLGSTPADELGKLPFAPRWTVVRTIAADDRLIDTLLDELARRGAAPGPTKHLVLVGEWDTIYSRAIGRNFAALLNTRNQLLPNYGYWDRQSWAVNPPFLHEYSYLRGLDGATMPKKKEGRESEPAPEGKTGEAAGAKKPAVGEGSENANGEAQLDYLRRIESQLRDLQIALAAEPSRDANGVPCKPPSPPAEIGAIGVIGSDTFDKLLVLRALRASFPRAIFFTTDLDAAYLDRREEQFTTNLLVASSYGLRATPVLQNRIPPFRDGYQTALFLTVLSAVGVTKVGGLPLDVTSSKINPRLFEVGRAAFRDLSDDRESARATGEDCGPLAQVQPDPRYRHAFHQFNIVRDLLSVLLLGIFVAWAWFSKPLTWVEWRLIAFALLWITTVMGLVAFDAHKSGGPPSILHAYLPGLTICFFFVSEWIAPPSRREDRHLRRFKWFCVAVFLILAVWGLRNIHVALMAIWSSPFEEPFAWFDGLSLWPTEIVRIAAAVVSVVMVVSADRRLRRMKRAITEKYNLDRATAEFAWDWHHPLISARRLWLDLPSPKPKPPASDPGKDTGLKENRWWASYCQVTTPRRRFARIMLHMSVYLLVFLLLMAIDRRPIVPARGEWSRALDWGILVGSVLAYLYLLFFVLDVTVMAAGLIRKFEGFVGEKTNLADGADIRLVNDLTNVVSSLIYLPFTILFMLIVSRNKLFDNWEWPPLLLGVLGSGLLMIFFAALLLQHRARHARQKAIENLDTKLLNYLSAESADENKPAGTSAKSREDILRELREQIEGFNGVAFQAWHQNPIFRALLIPLGGLGSIQLLEKLSSLL